MSSAARGEPEFTAPKSPWDAANVSRTQAIINCRAHYLAAEQQERLRVRLGAPATIIAAVVAAFSFATPGGVWVYVIGGSATVGAVLVGLQTFLNLSDRARNHRAAGIQFGAVRRRFDLALMRGDGPHVIAALETLYPELNEIAETSPMIPDRFYHKAAREIESVANIGRGKPLGRVP
jgi:hypothetical protein